MTKVAGQPAASPLASAPDRLASTVSRPLHERVEHLPGVFEIRRRGVMTGIDVRPGSAPFPATKDGAAGWWSVPSPTWF